MTFTPTAQLGDRIQELRRITGGSTSCGWMCDEVAITLSALVQWYKPQVVIQTGHLWGKSALVILEALADHAPLDPVPQNADREFTQFLADRSPAQVEGRLISLDPEPINVPHWRAGIDHLRNQYPRFEFHQAKSGDFFREQQSRLRDELAGGNLMGVVDGDHSWLGCLEDLDNLANLGAGLIVVDDTHWLPHIEQAARTVAKARGYQFLDLALYNGLGVLYRGARATAPTRAAAFAYQIGGIRAARFIETITPYVGRLPRVLTRPRTAAAILRRATGRQR